MKKFVKFPSIGQFRNAAHDHMSMAKNGYISTIVKLTGLVKLHGTNAAICFDKNYIWFQSRNNIISVDSDNCGFANYGNSIISELTKFRDSVHINDDEIYCLFGEWVGKGVQKGVALSELEKQFVPFESCIHRDNENYYFDIDETMDQVKRLGLYQCITDALMLKKEIDFLNWTSFQNELISITDGVENECPYGKLNGVSGIGEGVVWSYNIGHDRFRFKVKGDKHAKTSKIKKIKKVDDEKESLIIGFVNDYCCTDSRLNQAANNVFNLNDGGFIDTRKTGDFLKWIFKDINKEESDLMIEKGITSKDINSKVAFISKRWLNQLDKDSQ